MSLISRMFIVTFCWSSFAQVFTSLRDLERVDYLRAQSPSVLVREAIEAEAAFRKATQEEIRWYLSAIQASFSPSRRSLHEVRSAVLKRMRNDLATVKRLNREFASLSPLKDEITFSCKANRLVEILEAAIPFYEKHAHLIIAGLTPPEMVDYWDTVRCLGACEGHYDNHNALDLALKVSLVLTKLELEDGAHIIDEVVRPLLESAFVHATPLPKGKVLEGIQTLSMFYNGTLSPKQGELVFVHGGYAFGGQAQDTSASIYGVYGKRFGPQDCSSWMSKILGLPQIMSTVDFAGYYKDHEPIGRFQCASSNEFVVFDEVQKLEPVPVTSIADVLPGMILLTRKYNLEEDPTMQRTLGTSGHVQLIIDVDASTNTLLTLEYARNLPDYEGFGVRRVPFISKRDEKMMFLTLSESFPGAFGLAQ